MTVATVIVPTATGGPRLARLLESLDHRPGDVEVLVVDNGSADPAIDGLGARFGGVRAIRLGRNAGYSRAVNMAAREATGDALVLLNDDCVCDPGYVEAIVARLDRFNGVTMAAGVMREVRDPATIDTAGMQLDGTLLAFDYLNGEPVSCLDHGVADPIGPSGAAAAFDRRAFLAAGGFDENLFAYWEDVDLVLRLRREGSRCALAPGARGIHEHSATLGSGSARKDYLTGFGRGYLLRKWGVLTSPGRAARVLATDGVICLGQAVVDRNLGGLRGRIRGYRSGRPLEPYPHAALRGQAQGDRVGHALRRRVGRRARLRATSAGGAPRRTPRALAVFHAGEVSGPLRSLEAELRWLAGASVLRVVAPGPGTALETLGEVASVTELDYQPLMLPRGPLGLPLTLARLRRETRAFGALLRDTRPDLVLVISTLLPAALLAARRQGVPSIVYAAELHRGPEVASAFRRVTGRPLISLTDRLATEVIACSMAVADQFESPSRGRRRTPVTVIYPPIPDAYGDGDAAAFRRRHGIDRGARCLVAIGNLTPGRGQDVLVEALPAIRAAVPEAHCAIVGPTFARPQDVAFARFLRELARRRGVAAAITFAGPAPALADAYAAAAVAVNPARTPESFGRVACEALAAARPVVATRVGAVAEVLAGYGGVRLVPPGDPAAIASAAVDFLRDPEVGEAAAGAASQEVLRRFAPERSLAAFREVVARVAPIGTRR